MKLLQKGLVITLTVSMITMAIPVGVFADEAAAPAAAIEQVETVDEDEQQASDGEEVQPGTDDGSVQPQSDDSDLTPEADNVEAELQSMDEDDSNINPANGKEYMTDSRYVVKFFLRIGGSIPNEPGQYDRKYYSSQIETADVVKTTQKVDFNKSKTDDWVCDNSVADATWSEDKCYVENEVTKVLSVCPTAEEIQATLAEDFKNKKNGKNAKEEDYQFDPENQKVLWYVYKEATDNNVMNIHVDGVIVNKISLVYDANLPEGVKAGSYKNLPLGFSVSSPVEVAAGTDSEIDGQVKSPSTDGYKFIGWAETADGEVVYEAGDKFDLDDNKTLYAKWEKVDDVKLITDCDDNTTIDPDTNWDVNEKSYEYSETSSVKVSFSADEFYKIDSVEVDGKQLTGSALEKAIENGYVTVDRLTDHSVKVASVIDLAQIKLRFVAPDGEQTYNGKALTAVEGVTVEGFDLLKELGYTCTAVGNGSITNAGKAINGVDYKICDAEGNDVTDQIKNVTVVKGNLKVNPVEVTVKVGEYSKRAGSRDPEFKAELTGDFVEGDADKIVYQISRAEGEAAGEYVITPSGDATQLDGNYIVKYVEGKLTITAVENGGGSDGGRSSGGLSSEGDIVTIAEVEVPLAELNTVDHIDYMIGYEDGTVRPQNKITRAEVASIFFRLLTDESRASIWSTVNNFSDAPATQWFNNAVSTLSNGKILTGYEDGTFRPNGSITRAEFAAIACRFDNTMVNVDGISFSDIDGHWANEYIIRAAALGYLNGYEDGSFKPDAAITRAEAATLLNRVLGRDAVNEESFLSDMRTWTDNPQGTWYYLAIQEATNSHDYEMTDGVEKWTQLIPNPDWSDLEKSWSEANSVSAASVHAAKAAEEDK